MSSSLVNVIFGLLVLVGASAAAWYVKGRLDASTGFEAVGWAMTLMVANVLQLIGVVVILAGLFG
jgi:hypothetical protein